MPNLRVQRQEVYHEVANVCEQWGLVEMGKQFSSRQMLSSTASGDSRESKSASPVCPSGPGDAGENRILILLKVTTSAIRSVQRYFLSLPPENLPLAPRACLPNPESLVSKRSKELRATICVSAPIPFPVQDDPLIALRQANLTALGMLKDMELRYRQSGVRSEPGNLLVGSKPMDADSFSERLGIGSGKITPSLSSAEATSSDVSGSISDGELGHLYKDNVSLPELKEEANVVRQWIETVDSLIFQRLRKASTIEADQSLERLPRWTRPEDCENDVLGELIYTKNA